MSEEENVCAICQEVESLETCTELSCGHTFHSHCLVGWFRENPACPLCRDDPVMEPMSVRDRASMVRRFSKTKQAPPELKRLVKTLQTKESKCKDRRQALRDFKKRHLPIFKEWNRLRNAASSAFEAADRALCHVGLYHCDDLPVPPLREARRHH